MLNQAPGIISFRMFSRISLHYVLGPSMPTFFCIPTTQLNFDHFKKQRERCAPYRFISFQSFPGWKRGLCWKGLDCHLGKKLFGTPLGCVGTKDSRISMDISNPFTNFGARFDEIFLHPKFLAPKNYLGFGLMIFKLPVDLCDVLKPRSTLKFVKKNERLYG